ncbi:MAG: hypothetical protein NVSMB63_07930 [Sediminibacterium sp.]
MKAIFLQQELVPLLSGLEATEKGKWGKMNAQGMVEHVTDFFKISTGQVQFPLVTPEEQLPKFKAFLFSDKQFRENTKAPLSVIGEEPLPLLKANMPEAADELAISITAFFAYFASDPLQTALHPVFGPLNFEEWILLHYKHVTHHARQFGLME